MKDAWKDVIITKISLAVYVAPNTGKHIHKNRPHHGFVLNDTEGAKDYYFSDGQVLHTEGGDFFYLPKGSSYEVKETTPGGCYAINFDAEIADRPFAIKLRSTDALQKNFKAACSEWRQHDPACNAASMRAVYDSIYQVLKEQHQAYIPNDRYHVISPALEAIRQHFTDSGLTVAYLSQLCGISEVYFRKIFLHKYGISPKEYIIEKRMEYARQLLLSGQFDVSETAALCGYSEPCHFSREFKKHTGTAPHHYTAR